ncbi:hypothetical protein ACI2I2_06455 [Scandinavium sp. NPDC088450]|uniref:hypothetical protein n=1 Tax=Scandinavium sp. NPDC088450 TaxID=3364514 RepID=UPI003851745D
MSKKIHFLASAVNDYISPVSLWSVARVTVNDDGVNWLQTQWVGGGELHGMALYTSKLDAAVAAEVMNQRENSTAWQVYSFSDINITEMMINVKSQKPNYGIMLVFGFSIDDFRHLILHSNLYRSLQFPESFPIGDGLDPITNKAILKFNESFFEGMNDYWHEEFASYCETMDKQNSLPFDLIKEHARNAVSAALVTTTPIISAASQYCVSTYSIEKQMWVVSSLSVGGAQPANKLH